MLYIFHVDTGTTLQLDVNLAPEKVSTLKQAIARTSTHIPPDKQVLLISGGQALDDEMRVCEYSAGTDTNPIFLFNLDVIKSSGGTDDGEEYKEDRRSVVDAEEEASDRDLERRLERGLDLPACEATLSVRAGLANEYVSKANQLVRRCETLVHDQHLQHQGWQAVLVNQEEAVSDVQKHARVLERMFLRYLGNADTYRQAVENFDEDLALLHRIPVFPALQPPKEEDDPAPAHNLLEWINLQGNRLSLDDMSDSCFRSLNNLSSEMLGQVAERVAFIVEQSQIANMREIKGLSDRLQSLELMIVEARKMARVQSDVAMSIQQNLQRSAGLKDKSALPDLCASHCEQLKAIVRNHRQLLSLRHRINKGKLELCGNLCYRLRWVVRNQTLIAEATSNIVLHVKELRMLERRLSIIEQIHAAPTIYLATAVEIVRRKSFAARYRRKTNALSERFGAVYDEEINIRQGFQSTLKKHFLNRMFPGMTDFPPPFGLERVGEFDAQLPDVSMSDIEQLRQCLPQLAAMLDIPDKDVLADLLERSVMSVGGQSENGLNVSAEGEEIAAAAADQANAHALHHLSDKIKLNNNGMGDIGSVSVMNRLLDEPQAAARRVPRRASRKLFHHFRDYESETDEDWQERRGDIHHGRNGNGRRHRADLKKKASQSLTSSQVTSNNNTNVESEDKEQELQQISQDDRQQTNTTSAVGVASSCTSSSANPASSKSGNLSSMVPSSSSEVGGSMAKEKLDSQLMDQSDNVRAAAFKVAEVESKYEAFKTCVQGVLHCNLEDVSALKENVMSLRNEITQEKEDFLASLTAVRDSVVAQECAHEQQSEAAEASREKLEAEVDKLTSKLELETNKLEDCEQEVLHYRRQLEDCSKEIDRLKGELLEETQRLEREKQAEVSAVKEQAERDLCRAVVEHEMEMESQKAAEASSPQLLALKEELALKESELDALKRKTRLLETAQDASFQMEKDKMVRILEESFAQRERMALEKCREEVRLQCQKEHEQDLERRREDWRAEEAVGREALLAEHARELERQSNEAEERKEKALDEERKRFAEESERILLKEQCKFKSEKDALITKFKLMQSAAALERSPSASESELSMESPKMDPSSPRVRAAMAMEQEAAVSAERARWAEKTAELERQLQQLHLETDQAQRAKVNAELDMSASVAPVIQSADQSAEQRQKEHQQLKEQLTALNSRGLVSVKSVHENALVFVVWDDEHKSYMIYHEGDRKHFLHTSSLKTLGLKADDEGEVKRRIMTAVVVNKEYCEAKKSKNRYLVKERTRFFRVTCKKRE